jgi:hypothetical protein
LPVWAIHSPELARLTSFERDVYFSGIGGQDERHCLPFDEAALRSAIFPNRPFVGLSQIAAARARLVALGVWIHKISPRKEWLEIHPDYRHAKGNKETSYGDEPEAPVQGELGFAPVVVPRRAQKINGLRAEGEKSKATESGAHRGAGGAEIGDGRSEMGGGNRALSSGGGDAARREVESCLLRPEALRRAQRDMGAIESSGGDARSAGSGPVAAPGRMDNEKERFVRSVEELQGSALGKRWARFLGPSQVLIEARESGAEWARIFREEAENLEALLDQGERIREAELKTGLSRAKFLTGRLGERRAA